MGFLPASLLLKVTISGPFSIGSKVARRAFKRKISKTLQQTRLSTIHVDSLRDRGFRILSVIWPDFGNPHRGFDTDLGLRSSFVSEQISMDAADEWFSFANG